VTFLNVETVVHDWAVVVAPVGDIDAATVRTFDAELRRAESHGSPLSSSTWPASSSSVRAG
jgi:hypothetical protein